MVFPRHDIDPKKKDSEWILQYAKAAWDDSRTVKNSIFFHGKSRLRELRDYAMGNQSNTRYKNLIQPKDANGQSSESFVQLDFTIVPFIPKFRKIALGKVSKVKNEITATAIDPLARDHETDFFAEQKAKIILLKQLADVPNVETMLGFEEGEPQSLEELEIKMQYSYKHIAAIEAEQGIKLIQKNNRYEKILDQFDEDQFDFGVGGVREYFDENGVLKIRHVKMDEFGSGFCREPDFSDARYMFEVLRMTAEDIRKESGFSESKMEEITQLKGSRAQGRDNNFLRAGSRNWDDDKIDVLDIEFKSVNDMLFEERKNSAGNREVRKAQFSKKGKKDVRGKSYEVIYKCKWIIGTDYVYDDGLMTDMKRKKNAIRDTSFSFHIVAPSQDQMRFFGVVESMIPVADQIQIVWLKLQNLLLNMVPPGIKFNLDALENINIGHAGQAWTPMKILDMYKQRGDMAYRSRDKEGNPFPENPIETMQNSVAQEANNLANMINIFMNLLRDNIGFNEVTDGSTPDPRTLNGVANIAYQNTSNALNSLFMAKKYLNESVADSLVVRMQQAFTAGHKGYLAALGGNTHKFWMSKTDITLHELSVVVNDAPSDEDLMELKADVRIALESGQINIADKVFIDTIDNVKEKAAVLAHRVKKNQEQKQQEALAMQQQNGQIQQQSAMVAEEEKRKTMEFEHQLKVQFLQTEMPMKYELEMMKQQTRLIETDKREQGRVASKYVENQGKEKVAAMNQKNTSSKKEN